MLFYASVEQLDNPDLKGKPIALLVGQRIVVLLLVMKHEVWGSLPH
jgi:hypothetical protein